MSNPTPKLDRLPPDVLAALMKKAHAETITVGTIQSFINKGLPTNTDGTINFKVFAQWIEKSLNDNNRIDI